MPAPQYGALGMSFVVVRAMQICSLIAIIGMTANFISQMVGSSNTPPQVLVGTLSVTVIATLYCVITSILYYDMILPFLISTGLDSLLLIAVIVVAVTVGKPLSYLDCQVVGQESGDVNSAYAFTTALGSNINKVSGGRVDYSAWIGAVKSSCLEMKAIWGLSIALCILFSFSATTTALLWRRTKAAPPKTMEEE